MKNNSDNNIDNSNTNIYNNSNSYNTNNNVDNENHELIKIVYIGLITIFLISTLFLAFTAVFLENNQINSQQTTNEFKSYDSIYSIFGIGTPVINKEESSLKVVNKASAASNVSSSSKAKLSSIGSSKSVSQSSVLSASKNLKNYVNKNKKLPNSVTVEGYKYSIPEFTYLMTKTIEYKKKKVSSRIDVKYNIKNPSKPSGKTIKTKISSSSYYNYALKTTKYINNYKKVPNYLSGTKGAKIQYQTAVYMFSSVLSYNYYKKKLPSSISLSVSSSHKMNKNIPKYVRTSKTKSVPNKNSIWIQSKDFTKINLDKLSQSGIGNVFLHEATISKYGKSKVISWAKTAASKGIKTHLWIQCFYSDGKWINPVNTATKSYNQAQFNKILSKIKTFSRMDYIGGIHLDYLRYPGTAYKYRYSNGVTGEKAITKFVSQAKSYVNKYNANILLSAAVMPETSSNAYYYGQNIPQIGKYLDIITPMVYKGNYNKDSSWITSITKWFVKNSDGARIWTGIQTYKSDNNPTALSASALNIDCKAILSGGADGIGLFRWGLTVFFNFLSVY